MGRMKTFKNQSKTTLRTITQPTALFEFAKFKRREMVMILTVYSRFTKDIVGIGCVIGIKKGKDFDIVEMNFGLSSKHPRQVIVSELRARKQLALLKKNEYALMVGKMRLSINDDHKDKMIFYAKLFMPFYTPKVVDMANLDIETDFEVIKEDSEEYEEGKDFLSQFE